MLHLQTEMSNILQSKFYSEKQIDELTEQLSNLLPKAADDCNLVTVKKRVTVTKPTRNMAWP